MQIVEESRGGIVLKVCPGMQICIGDNSWSESEAVNLFTGTFAYDV